MNQLTNPVHDEVIKAWAQTMNTTAQTEKIPSKTQPITQMTYLFDKTRRMIMQPHLLPMVSNLNQTASTICKVGNIDRKEPKERSADFSARKHHGLCISSPRYRSLFSLLSSSKTVRMDPSCLLNESDFDRCPYKNPH